MSTSSSSAAEREFKRQFFKIFFILFGVLLLCFSIFFVNNHENNKYVIETKTCLHCKKTGTVKILTRELFYIRQGYHIQDAVKSLDIPEREQLISGIHGNCWEEMFGVFEH